MSVRHAEGTRDSSQSETPPAEESMRELPLVLTLEELAGVMRWPADAKARTNRARVAIREGRLHLIEATDKPADMRFSRRDVLRYTRNESFDVGIFDGSVSSSRHLT